MAKKKKKNATLTGALGSYLEEKFGNKEEKKTTSKVTTDENGNVTINNSPKKEREGILVTGVKKTISGKSSIPSKILGLATNGIGEVIYNTVEAGINESKNKKVEQTVDTIKKDSDTAYNKLKDYKKENNINLFNENSKRVQNDEKYQGLLKEAQEKTTTLEKERTNRNSEIIKDAVKEKSGTLSGGIIKTGTTLAGGFETGIGGIESTTKKILGQTPSLDDQEIKYNMFSDVAQNNINTTKNPVGRAGLEMTYSIGQMLPQMMTGNSAGALATGFANYGGSAYNEAKKDGATEEQATKYGIVSGTLEMAMEKALGGFESVYGKSALGKSTNKLTSKVLDKFVKNKALRKTLTSMKGEFTEEYLQEFLGPIVEEALLEKDNGVGIKNSKNAKELASNIASYTAKNFFSTQNLYAGTLGAVTSGVMEGSQNIARNQWAKQTGRDFDTGYTQNEQKVIDEIVKKEITKKSREQAINTEIENAIKEQEQNFSISEENKNKIAERIKKEYENKDIDLSNTKLSDKEIKSIRKSVEKSLQEGTIDADEISNILGNDTDISKDDLLHRSFYEKSQKSVNYQYEENKTDSDITKALKESASKVMNNTTKSRNFVENVNKIAQERGTRYEFVNNEQLEKMGYEVKGKDINGLVGKDLQGNEKILINIDSKQALNKIVGHETTHLLEGTEEYTLLQNAVKEYAKSKGDYDHRIKSTEKLYSGLDANIENEVTSDLVGEYIFNDEEFIKKLSTSQPNVFTKIYDYVKHLYNTVTAGSQEARDLEKVKYRFEQAYKENVKGKTSEKTKYSIQEDSKGNKYVNIDTDQDIFKGKNLYEQNKIAKQYILDNFRGKELSINDENVNITRTTANEYTHPRTTLQKKDASSKMKASTELDNLLSISEYKYSKPDDGRHSFAKDGWDYYETTFKVGDNIYTGLVNIAKNGNKKMLYDITNLKRNTLISSSVNTATESIGIPFSDTNIPQSNKNVKSDISTKYSMQESTNNTQELENSSFSLEQRVSGDALLDAQDFIDEVKSVGAEVDEKGYVTVYHQTSNENAAKIKQSGKMIAKEDYVYFSTSKDASQSEGRGQTKMEFKIPAEKLMLDDIFSDNADVKIPLKGSKELNVSDYLIDNTKYSLSDKANNEEELKEKQYKIIESVNPAEDEYHTWIRNSEDIKTFEETLNDPDWIDYREEGFDPDYTGDMINDALKTGEIMVYSSYPIEMGTFVSPSKMEAETYSGNGKIYSKKVNLTDIAWIDPTQGQYAKINNLNSTKNSDIRYSLSEKNVPIADKYKSDENSNYKNEYSPLETNRKKTIDEKVERALQKGSYKAIQSATKTAQNYLDFDYQEKKDFRNKMKSFYNMTKEDLTNSKTYNEINNIISEYANREYNYIDKEVESVKKEIRNSRIKVSDELKNQITDYGDFRKSNFGKLRLGNEGQSVDSIYQELSNKYPYYFSNEITGEADMLTELSDFMNQDTTITEKYRITDSELKKVTDRVFNNLLNNSVTEFDLNEIQKQLESKAERKTRAIVQQELLNEMGITLDDIQVGNDINAIAYQRTDPIRLNEKVFGYEVGKKINDATINQTKHNTAEKTRWLNQEREDIKKLGIKARSKESAAVQKYVEKVYINEHGEEIPYGDKELATEFPDVKTQEKIKHASEVFRNKYDTYIDQINNVLTDLGYDAIPKRKDYMRHFTEISDKLSQWGVPFNRNDMDSENLPTDINGLTEFNRPGKNWFASSLERKGMKTTYDAITGIDGYLEGAGNLIFHTADIQRYRTLSKFIRETYGQTHGLDNVDSLTDAEFEQRVADIQDNKLSKYVAWLDEQANALAGKKGAIDRAAERFLGRRVYTALNTLKSQVGSNMTGFNVRSALTNFASAVQGASKTSKLSFVKGTVSTINNIFHKDGLIDKSDFLTARFGSDTLSQKAWQKISNAGQIFMSGSDYFTSNQIWRSKYFENLSKGMKEQEAISNADDFSARIMGDRSQGSTAELFNSKTLGFLTQFQLEVNNQWSSMIHDNKMDIESGNKSGAGVVFQLGQLFGASYLFNSLMKSLTGSSVMFDPIDMLMKIFDDDDDKSLEEKFESAIGDFMDNIPMWSVFSGGRIPIKEAMTGATSLIKKLTGQTDSFGNEITWEDVGQDFLESAAYYVLPTGYGQLRKTVQGLKMYDDDLPIAGSYTDSGNLRFTADNSTTGKIKSALFGRYSSKEAQDYIDSGYKSINSSKIDEMIDLGMNSTEYRNYRNGLSKVGTKTKDKIEYINNLDVSNKKKSIMASNVLKKNIDMSNYDNYGSYEEFNYAMKNPVEYKQINMITDYSNYQKIQKELSKIKSDIDKNGNAISGSRKKKVISYINSLNLSIAQKAMLIKQEYPSFTKYDKQIFNYINGQDLTFIEKARTMKSLGFTQFDNQIIAYVRKHYPKVSMQIDVLKDLGFKVYEFNGKTYVKR